MNRQQWQGRQAQNRRHEEKKTLGSPSEDMEGEMELTFAGGLWRLIIIRVFHRIWYRAISTARVKVKLGI